MNKVITTLGLVSVLSLTGCNKTEEVASFGAGIGALAGQAIGNDTGSTLIGAGIGALLGGAIGNDQQSQNNSYNQSDWMKNDIGRMYENRLCRWKKRN